jgi:hypothetical protein
MKMIHQNLQNLKKSIKYLLSLSAAFLYLIYFIFKKIKNLNISKDVLITNFNKGFIFIEVTTIIFFVLVCIIIFSFITKKIKSKPNNIIVNFQQQISLFFETFLYIPLRDFDKQLKLYLKNYFKIKRITQINKILTYIYTKLYQNKFKPLNKYILLYLFIKYIPRFLTLLSFLLDVFYFKTFYIFYWCLPLLFIPLVLQYVKYIFFEEYKELLSRSDKNLIVLDIIPGTPDNLLPMLSITEYLEKAFNLVITNKPNTYEITLSYAFFLSRPDEESSRTHDYSNIRQHYIKGLRWVEVVDVIYNLLTNLEKRWDNYVNFIIYVGYLIGWGSLWIYAFINIFPEYFLFIPIENNPFSGISE